VADSRPPEVPAAPEVAPGAGPEAAPPERAPEAEPEPAPPEAAAEVDPEEQPSEPGHVVVTLMRNSSMEKFGFVWDPQAMDRHLLRVVDRISPGSLAERWNSGNPSRAVGAGDLLVRVNGKAGALEVLSRELARGGRVVCEFKPAHLREALPAVPGPASRTRGPEREGGGRTGVAKRRVP